MSRILVSRFLSDAQFAEATAGMSDGQRVRFQFEYEEEMGLFMWVHPSPRSHMHSGDVAGSLNGDGYVHIRFKGVITKGHVLAWLYKKGEWPDHEIDHIDSNRSNNAWTNLRPASYAKNAQNRCLQKNNKTGYTGIFISITKRFGIRYKVMIAWNRVCYIIGYFPNLEEAIRARLKAKKRLHKFNPVPREILESEYAYLAR